MLKEHSPPHTSAVVPQSSQMLASLGPPLPQSTALGTQEAELLSHMHTPLHHPAPESVCECEEGEGEGEGEEGGNGPHVSHDCTLKECWVPPSTHRYLEDTEHKCRRNARRTAQRRLWEGEGERGKASLDWGGSGGEGRLLGRRKASGVRASCMRAVQCVQGPAVFVRCLPLLKTRVYPGR